VSGGVEEGEVETPMPRVVPSQVVELIDMLLPDARNQVEGKDFVLYSGHMNQLSVILEMVQQIPPELIVLNTKQYLELLTSSAAIKTQIQQWQSVHGDSSFRFVTGLRKLSPVTLIRQALDVCPNEYPSAETSELNFIPDNDLRESLRRDMSAANSALSNGEWKAATVLGGSVVEALLLWALQEKRSNPEITGAVKKLVASKTLDKNPGAILEKWSLHDFVEVSEELGVIGQGTATQTRLAKDYRNLIHPGRAQRLGQICNRATALSAVAALEHVIEDLSR